MYKAQVLTDNSTPKEYIGMTGNSFKEIFNNHTKSFNNKIYKNSTELSKYVWHLKEKRSDFTNKWSIQKRADSYSNGKKSCNLYNGYYTIIGRDWAKYRDLSVASRSIICRCRRPRQIIDLRATDKSRYFAIAEFNNCFIIYRLI